MKNPALLQILLVGFVLLATVGTAYPQASIEPGMLRNPLNVDGGADPWLTYYDGNYYLATTTWTSTLTMRKSPTLAGLKTAAPVPIYFETDPSRCCNMWAPEFDLLNGPDGLRWYFYYTAGNPPGQYGNQRSYVLESSSTDPMGPYTYKAQLVDPTSNSWSIDGSVMKLNDSLYFLSSGFVGKFQSLMIAPMSNPWTISGARVPISQPQYAWEQIGGLVNEGPVALEHGGKTFIVYSASSCNTPDYKLGMLTYNGGDPTSAASWIKSPDPVFQRSDANGVFAPGHNGFFTSPDGTEDWIVYHANSSTSAGCDGERTMRVQKFSWNADGSPNFGVPVSTSEEIAAPSGDTGVDPMPGFPPLAITRFQSYGLDGAYLRHANFVARVDFNVMPLADSQFVIVPGLADATAVSIESVNFPDFYLRHQNRAIVLSSDNHSASYDGDATWWARPGLVDSTWTSFESYNQPGSYIGKLFGVTALTSPATKLAREDATFQEQP